MTVDKRKTYPSLKPFRKQLEIIERRAFLKQTLSIGALSLLSGCTLKDEDAIDKVLWSMSGWNDRVQSFLFSPKKLAKTYTEAEITNPFPFNAYYEEILAPIINGENYRLKLSGKIDDKRPKTISDLRLLPQELQITQHVCVEGWSAVGKWGGVP